jgi:hypothetical protein
MGDELARELGLDLNISGVFEEQVAWNAPGADPRGADLDFAIVTVDVRVSEPPRLWNVLYASPRDATLIPSAARLLDLAIAARRARVRAGAEMPHWVRVSGSTVDEAWAHGLRQRNRVTSDLLEEAAKLYLEGGAQAVADGLHVSRRQASRYVQRARERGLLV